MPAAIKNCGPCSVCGGEVYSKHRAKMHKECVPEYNRQQASRLKTVPIQNLDWYHKGAPVLSSSTEITTPKGRPFDDPRNNVRLNKAREEGRVEGLSPIRVAVTDIETTGLNAGFGVVLAAVTQIYGPEELRVRRADDFPAWQRGERANDKDLVAAILSDWEEADIIIAHNGLRFDLPFIRTRAVIHGLPPVNFQKIIDPCQLARTHFRFPGNSLNSIQGVLGTPTEKTPLVPEVWQRATMNGDKDALDEIVEHCRYDVQVLSEITFKLRGYVKKIDSLGSFRG